VNENVKNRFPRTFSSNVNRFTSNQDQYDYRPILHLSSSTFHQRKCFVFVTFVCIYPRAATWPRTAPIVHVILSMPAQRNHTVDWVVRWVQSGPDLCLPYRRRICCAAQPQAIESDELYRITTTTAVYSRVGHIMTININYTAVAHSVTSLKLRVFYRFMCVALYCYRNASVRL